MLIPFQPYGDTWRRMRRAAHEGLSPSASKLFLPSQEKEACLMVDGMLQENLDWQSEIARSSLSMSGGWVYDMPTIESCHDPVISYGNDFIGRIVRSGFPGAHFAEFFPWMKHLPSWMAKWKREAEYHFKKDDAYYRDMFQTVEKRLDAGDERVSFTSILHQDAKHTGITYTEKVWLAATILCVIVWREILLILTSFVLISATLEVKQRAQRWLGLCSLWYGSLKFRRKLRLS